MEMELFHLSAQGIMDEDRMRGWQFDDKANVRSLRWKERKGSESIGLGELIRHEYLSSSKGRTELYL